MARPAAHVSRGGKSPIDRSFKYDRGVTRNLIIKKIM